MTAGISIGQKLTLNPRPAGFDLLRAVLALSAARRSVYFLLSVMIATGIAALSWHFLELPLARSRKKTAAFISASATGSTLVGVQVSACCDPSQPEDKVAA